MTSFLAERRKKPFVPMKTEQNGGKCDNQCSKRHREKETYLHFGAKRGVRDGMEDEEEVMRGPEEKSA